MTRPVLAVLALYALGCSAPPAHHIQAKPPGRYVEHLTVGGLNRKFILDVPPGYDGSKPIPMVVVLHGWTGSAEDAEQSTGMAREGAAHRFVVVFPDGTGQPGMQGWNAMTLNLGGKSNADDSVFVAAAMDQVEREIDVDRDREYVCGHSNGAFLANTLGAEFSNRLAAIGSVAGSIGVGGRMVPNPQGPISVILIHGKKDGMVAYGPHSSALLKSLGAEESARWWATKDGCSLAPQVTTSPNGNVTTIIYSGGNLGTEVELVSIANGGHSWPGGLDDAVRETTTGVSAADLLWTFFEGHPRRR